MVGISAGFQNYDQPMKYHPMLLRASEFPKKSECIVAKKISLCFMLIFLASFQWICAYYFVFLDNGIYDDGFILRVSCVCGRCSLRRIPKIPRHLPRKAKMELCQTSSFPFLSLRLLFKILSFTQVRIELFYKCF